jgi:hypothetical protein
MRIVETIFTYICPSKQMHVWQRMEDISLCPWLVGGKKLRVRRHTECSYENFRAGDVAVKGRLHQMKVRVNRVVNLGGLRKLTFRALHLTDFPQVNQAVNSNLRLVQSALRGQHYVYTDCEVGWPPAK